MPSAPLLFTGCESENLKIEKMILCASVMKEQWLSGGRCKQSTNTVPVGVYKCEREHSFSHCASHGETQVSHKQQGSKM